MSIIVRGGSRSAGVNPGAEQAIDPSRGAGRVSLSPIDTTDLQGNILGHYRTVCISGALVSIGANGILFSARWAGPLPPVAVITRIQAGFEITTAVTVATPINFEAVGLKGFTAANTGGVTITPTRMRASMSLSSFADFRMATTAALGGGTQTLDAVGFGYAALSPKVSPDIGATAATGLAVGVSCPMVDLYKWEPTGHPFVLGVNEGFLIRESQAGPTTGTYRVTLVIEHMEVAGF